MATIISACIHTFISTPTYSASAKRFCTYVYLRRPITTRWVQSIVGRAWATPHSLQCGQGLPVDSLYTGVLMWRLAHVALALPLCVACVSCTLASLKAWSFFPAVILLQLCIRNACRHKFKNTRCPRENSFIESWIGSNANNMWYVDVHTDVRTYVKMHARSCLPKYLYWLH